MTKPPTPATPDAIALGTLNLKDLDRLTETLSLAELGLRLPLGLWVDGERLSEVDAGAYTGELYQELAPIAEDLKTPWDESLVKIFPKVLTAIGGRPLKDVAAALTGVPIRPDIKRMIGKLYLADAIALAFALRLKLMESGEIELSWKCGNCGTNNRDNGKTGDVHDLSGADVLAFRQAVAPAHEPVFRVDLPDGLVIDGVPITHVLMRPPRLEDAKFLRNGKSYRIEAIRRLVTALPDHETYRDIKGVVFGPEVFAAVRSPYVLPALENAIVEIQKFGVDATVEVECRNCGNKDEIAYPYQAVGSFLSVPAATPV